MYDPSEQSFDIELDAAVVQLHQRLNSLDRMPRVHHLLQLASGFLEIAAYDLAQDGRRPNHVTQLILTSAELERMKSQLPANDINEPD